MWRRHSCLLCRDSSRHLFAGVTAGSKASVGRSARATALDEHFLVLGGGVHAALVAAHQGRDRGGDAGGNAVDLADGTQDGALHRLGNVLDLIDGALPVMIDLLQTGTG